MEDAQDKGAQSYLFIAGARTKKVLAKGADIAERPRMKTHRPKGATRYGYRIMRV
jgi:hypothetical protein